MISGLVMSDSATPRTVAHQAPPSLGFFQASVLVWVFLPSPGIFQTQRSNPRSLCLLHRRWILLPAEPLGAWKEQF